MALLGGQDARAASYTWVGSGTTSLWSTPLNWSPGVPLSATGTNSVVFRGSTKTSNFVNGTYTVDRLEFASGAAPFTVGGTSANKTIVMRGAIVNSSSNKQTIGGTTALQSLIVRYGTNTATRVIDTGTSGGSIVINANLIDSSEAVTLRKLGTGALTINNPPGSTQNFSGTFDFTSGTTTLAATFNGSPTIQNGGGSTLHLNGSIASGAITNSGTLNLASQMGALANSGIASLETGAAIGGALVNTGTMYVTTNVQVDGSGSDLTGGAIVFSGIGDPGTNPTMSFNQDVLLGGSVVVSLDHIFPEARLGNAGDHAWCLFDCQGGVTGSFTSIMATYDSQTLAFTKGAYPGQPELWVSTATSRGQWLQFDQVSGQVVVVPEPSTYVFAGIGVTIAAWKGLGARRRRMRSRRPAEKGRYGGGSEPGDVLAPESVSSRAAAATDGRRSPPPSARLSSDDAGQRSTADPGSRRRRG